MNLRACPSSADTTVTLGVHNMAHFFVLASRTRKNTSTPPQVSWGCLETCSIHSQEYYVHFRPLIQRLGAPGQKGS